MEFVQPIRDKEKLAIMKKYLKGSNLRDYCLFVVGINSGLRISDLLELTVSDVINKNTKVKDRIQIREIKTGNFKDFPISTSAKKAITEYLNTREYNLTDPLFISQKNLNGSKAIQRQRAYRVINDAAKVAGIKEKIGTHTLRKTFAYHAYKAGISIEVIQKLFNHSAPSITLRYIGITQDTLDNVYINLNL